MLSIVGCSKGPSLESALGLSLLPSSAVVQQISYMQNGASSYIFSPITGSQNISPDYSTGVCSASAEVVVQGSFDSLNTSSWAIQGVKSSQVVSSGDQFTIKLCLAKGASLVTLKTLNAAGASQTFSPQISFNLSSKVQTLGFGHPTYPQPGFRAQNATTPLRAYTNQASQLANFSIGEMVGVGLTSASQPSMKMEIGFVNIISQVGP